MIARKKYRSGKKKRYGAKRRVGGGSLPRYEAIDHGAVAEVKATDLLELLNSRDFVPQAVVNNPVQTFANSVQAHVVRDADDFDEYEGIAFSINRIPIAIMHYKGHPPGTSTIYLPRSISELESIGSILHVLFSHFNLPTSAIVWQRKDNPEL
jgi:hypothetical protein